MKNEDWISEELEQLDQEQARRQARCFSAAGGRIEVDGRNCLNLSSNNYLGLAGHPHVVESARIALETYGAGATASRLVCGTLPIHEELEKRMAARKGYADCMVFGSGYMTNAGLIPVLAGKEDTILADRLVHASMIDAARLSGARLKRFHHNDPEHLERRLAKTTAGRTLVLTEAVFSMDGDLAPLPALASVCKRYEALFMVDEAHSSGIFGPAGSGLIARDKLQGQVNVSMGTFSKALGGYGGFAACSGRLKELLVNRARAFVYTTAPAPAAAGAALGALDVLEEQPELGQTLLQRADQFRTILNEAGLDTLDSASQIIPVLIGENHKALEAAATLRDQGILAVAIRPPTVPPGTARLRLSLSLEHDEQELNEAAVTIAETLRKL